MLFGWNIDNSDCLNGNVEKLKGGSLMIGIIFFKKKKIGWLQRQRRLLFETLHVAIDTLRRR